MIQLAGIVLAVTVTVVDIRFEEYFHRIESTIAIAVAVGVATYRHIHQRHRTETTVSTGCPNHNRHRGEAPLIDQRIVRCDTGPHPGSFRRDETESEEIILGPFIQFCHEYSTLNLATVGIAPTWHAQNNASTSTILTIHIRNIKSGDGRSRLIPSTASVDRDLRGVDQIKDAAADIPDGPGCAGKRTEFSIPGRADACATWSVLGVIHNRANRRAEVFARITLW